MSSLLSKTYIRPLFPIGGFSVMSDIANVLNHVFSATTYTAKAAEKLKKVTIWKMFVSTKNVLESSCFNSPH